MYQVNTESGPITTGEVDARGFGIPRTFANRCAAEYFIAGEVESGFRYPGELQAVDLEMSAEARRHFPAAGVQGLPPRRDGMTHYSDHYTAARYVATSGGTCREGAASSLTPRRDGMTDAQRNTLDYVRDIARETGARVEVEVDFDGWIYITQTRGAEWDFERTTWRVAADGTAHIL